MIDPSGDSEVVRQSIRASDLPVIEAPIDIDALASSIITQTIE